MRIFEPLYKRAIKWAAYPRAPLLLVVLSFFEAIIFPVMPEVMLAPMSLAQPKRGLWFATLSLAGSMVGALVGYYLGHFVFQALKPLFATLGMLPSIESGIATVQAKMAQSPWELFAYLIFGSLFTPIPLKIFAWASGFLGIPLLPYFAGILIGRGKRVYVVAGAIRLGGARAEAAVHRWIEPIGWIASALFVVLVGWLVWKVKHAG
jgi:membrane protein YqaA with SNARE-associated domain